MTTLWLRSRNDVPHRIDPRNPGSTACGLALRSAQKIDELQALVYLDDARCATCWPGWATHHGHGRKAAA